MGSKKNFIELFSFLVISIIALTLSSCRKTITLLKKNISAESISFSLTSQSNEAYFSQYNSTNLSVSNGLNFNDISFEVISESGSVSASGVYTPDPMTPVIGNVQIKATHSSGTSSVLTLQSLGIPFIWIVAQDLADSFNDGDSVSQWSNRSGQTSGLDMTFTSAASINDPTFEENDPSLNNLSYLSFDTDDCLTTPDNYPVLDGFEVFIVLRDDGVHSNFAPAFGFPRDDGFSVRRYSTNDEDWGMSINTAFGGSDHALISSISYTEDNWFVFHGRRESGSNERFISINGTDLITNDPANGSLTANVPIHAGCDGGARNFNGHIAEVILYNSNLSASARTFIINYLLSKYNISP